MNELDKQRLRKQGLSEASILELEVHQNIELQMGKLIRVKG